MRKPNTPNHDKMQSFTLKNIPGLDTCVLGALELFSTKKLAPFNIPKNKKLLVVGSGNAEVTGRIIFKNQKAEFASESTYKEVLKKEKFDLAVIISASGGKHAPIIAKYLKKKRIKSILITNNENAPAKPSVKQAIVLPKQREPYTYNTSTYLSMILSRTKESPRKILNSVKKIESLLSRKNFSKYSAFYFIIPEKFDEVREMFITKFDELFGPMLLGRVYTKEQTKHAKTVVNSKKELFISLGWKNNLFGYKQNRLNIPLSESAGFAEAIAVGYHIIGKIQKAKPSYFRKNISNYTSQASKLFRHKINPIVE